MDIYYQTLVLYLVFFFLYALIKGKFFEEKFELVFNDPIIYILIIFIPIVFLTVLINFIRGRQIILKKDRIVLKNRFGSREILHNEIITIKIGRTRRRSEDMPYRIIKLKLRNRRKQLRIRANDFERGPELIREFLKLKNPAVS